jgi:hypothetical protein
MRKKKVKTKRKTKPNKQKIDVVIESLVHLEQRVKELIEEVNQLKNKNHHYYPPYQPPKDDNKYWPVDYPKYKDVTWDAIDKGLQ